MTTLQQYEQIICTCKEVVQNPNQHTPVTPVTIAACNAILNIDVVLSVETPSLFVEQLIETIIDSWKGVKHLDQQML